MWWEAIGSSPGMVCLLAARILNVHTIVVQLAAYANLAVVACYGSAGAADSTLESLLVLFPFAFGAETVVEFWCVH